MSPAVGRPFLKWAGGKGRIVTELEARAPREFGAYFEPFVGSGAFFLALRATGRVSKACLADVNPALIDTWAVVRDQVEPLIRALRRHAARHDRDYFYQQRGRDPARLGPVGRAARLIYLNRTCFNGLYRENRAGQFNVPYGRYVRPRICDPDNLRAVSAALHGVRLACEPFEAVLGRARPGDFVYFDPPYQPRSPTASFTAYARSGFGERDQRRLADLVLELQRQGVAVLLSNSDTPLTRALYAGFRTDTIQVRRSINRRADGRGRVPEIVVRTAAPTGAAATDAAPGPSCR